MPSHFVEFLAAAVVMEITPGPNMTWLALTSAREGRAAGFTAVAGITTGLAILAVVAASGAAAVLSSQPALYGALRWGGVLFLLYLAWEAWVGGANGDDSNLAGRHFRRGLMVNLLNPKAAAVFVVMIPGFASAAAAPAPTQVAMTIIYLAIATLAHGLIVAFAGSFQRFLADPRREKIVRRIFALTLVTVAIWFAVSA